MIIVFGFIAIFIVSYAKILLYPSSTTVNGNFNVSSVCNTIPNGVTCTDKAPWMYTYSINVQWLTHVIVNSGDTQIATTLLNLYQTSNFSSVYNNTVWYGEKYTCDNWSSTSFCGGGQTTHPVTGKDVMECVDSYKVMCLCLGVVSQTTSTPSKQPTKSPLVSNPSKSPTKKPSKSPTIAPNTNPTLEPTNEPSFTPSFSPTKNPTQQPSNNPSNSPSKKITSTPTNSPSKSPSQKATTTPTKSPSKSPTKGPSSATPTSTPTFNSWVSAEAIVTGVNPIEINEVRIFLESDPGNFITSPTLSPTVFQSSNASPTLNLASKAIDGSTGGIAASDQVSITASVSEKAWWRVRAPGGKIFKIELWPRVDCCSSTLATRNIYLRIRYDGVTDPALTSSVYWSKPIVVTHSTVKIPYFPSFVYTTFDVCLTIERLAGSVSTLDIMEIQVFLKSNPTTNIISGYQFTSQDSEFPGFPSSNTIDGDFATFSATGSSGSAHWYSVYLGALAWQDLIIKVYPRAGGATMAGNYVRVRTTTTAFPTIDPTVTTNVVFGYQVVVGSLSSLVPHTFIPVDIESTRWVTEIKITNGLVSNFGSGIAINEDETIMVVGASAYALSVGGIWIYKRSGTSWVLTQAGLTGTGNIGESYQGYSVGVYGTTIVVGGLGDDDYDLGKIWIFDTLDSTTWTQTTSFVGTTSAAYTQMGRSVAIYEDTIVAGGFGDNNFVGAVWVFVRSLGVWSQQGSKLVGSGYVGPEAYMGTAVTLWGDTLAFGGIRDDTNRGAVWVYTRTAGVWSQQGSKLTPTGSVGSVLGFGTSVSLYQDTLAIGSGQENSNNVGAVYVFTRSAGVWTQQTRLVGSQSIVNQLQGCSVSLWGNYLAVGAKGSVNPGSAYIFRNTNGLWEEVRHIYGTDKIGNSEFGNCVALGSITLNVCGVQDNSLRGAVWSFVRD
jgi:hypothetical protein